MSLEQSTSSQHDSSCDIFEEYGQEGDAEGIECVKGKKRAREDPYSDSDSWKTIRRTKVGRKATEASGHESNIQVSVTSKSPLPKQFGLARLFNENKVTEVLKVKYINQFKMLVTFKDDSHADQFIACKALASMGWLCQKTSEVGLSFGIIKGIELDISEEELKKNLSCDFNIEIVSVKRLKRRSKSIDKVDAGWVPCESIRVGFRGGLIPAYVSIYDLKVKVERFKFPVSQCSRCWRFGHTLRMCQSKSIVCPKCTDSHENCASKSYKCVNCTGDHMALDRRCPVYKKENRIRDIMAESNCTYRKALAIYAESKMNPSKSDEPVLGEALCDVLIVEDQGSTVAVPINQLPISSKKSYSEVARTVPTLSKPVPKRKKVIQKSTTQAPNVEVEVNWDNFLTSQSECSVDSPPPPKPPRKRHSKDSKVSYGFTQLFIRLKNILLGEESFKDKINSLFLICVEWLPKLISFFSEFSFKDLFVNNG